MILTIIKNDNKDLSQFLTYLIQIAKQYLNQNKNYSLCNSWNDYFESIGDLDFDTSQILSLGFNNLRSLSYADKYVIEINPTIKYKNQNLSTICQMINDGTLDQPAYPIFDNAFNYLKKHISALYKTFQLRRKQKNVI